MLLFCCLLRTPTQTEPCTKINYCLTLVNIRIHSPSECIINMNVESFNKKQILLSKHLIRICPKCLNVIQDRLERQLSHLPRHHSKWLQQDTVMPK